MGLKVARPLEENPVTAYVFIVGCFDGGHVVSTAIMGFQSVREHVNIISLSKYFLGPCGALANIALEIVM